MLFDTALDTQLKILKFFGMWTPERFILFYRLYEFVLHSIFSIAFITFMFLAVIEVESLDQITSLLYICLTELCYLMKIFTMHTKHKIIKQWVEDIKIEFNNLTYDEKNIFMKRTKFVKRITFIYFGMSLTACAASYFVPFFSDEVSLPFQAWYPIPWRTNKRDWIIAFVYQVLSMGLNCILNITCDAFQFICMNLIQIYMEIIQKRIEQNLNEKTRSRNSVQDLIEIISNTQKLKSNLKCYITLIVHEVLMI